MMLEYEINTNLVTRFRLLFSRLHLSLHQMRLVLKVQSQVVEDMIDLLNFLGGRVTPGIGFAIGIERLLELVKMQEDEKDVIYLRSIYVKMH